MSNLPYGNKNSTKIHLKTLKRVYGKGTSMFTSTQNLPIKVSSGVWHIELSYLPYTISINELDGVMTQVLQNIHYPLDPVPVAHVQPLPCKWRRAESREQVLYPSLQQP
jgi:hypothetical protein